MNASTGMPGTSFKAWRWLSSGESRNVESRIGLGLAGEVGANPHHRSLDFGGRALVEGWEAQRRILADRHLVDIADVAMRTSTLSTSMFGTIDIAVSPGLPRLQPYARSSSCTTPDLRCAQQDALELILGRQFGARASSPIRASISRSSLVASVRMFCSRLIICSSVSLIWPWARAICATISGTPFPFELGSDRAGPTVIRLIGISSFLAHALEPLELLDHQRDLLHPSLRAEPSGP